MTLTDGPISMRRFADQKQIEADVQKEIAGLKDKSGIAFRVEPRCRVCQQETSRMMVNKMLANAMTYTEIFEMAEMAINPTRAKNSKVTYHSIRLHAQRHFNLEEPAKGAYRRMLERRKAESAIQQRGVERLITALGFLDVVVQKGYETLIKDETYISATVGMEAAIKLHELSRREAGQQEVAELKQQLNVALSAVKEVVPQEYWAEIVARIEDAETRVGTHVVDAEVIGDYDEDDDEPYSPPVEGDIDDTLES